MRYIFISICFAALTLLSACGDTVIMTPEYIDPSDSVSSSEVSSQPVSQEESDSDPVSSSREETVSSEPSSEPETESSIPPVEITLTIAEDSAEPLWDDGQFICTKRILAYNTDDLAGAGVLTYDYLQMTDGAASAAFNSCWKDDLIEWEESVRSTALANAELARENSSTAAPYSIDLPAAVWQRGGLISVARHGLQISGEERFSFLSNRCFDAQTGDELTLWQLFTAPAEDVAARVTDALTVQAQVDGYGSIDAAALFAPTDFSCGDGGFIFRLTLENEYIDLTIPYENFTDILAYPLWE